MGRPPGSKTKGIRSRSNSPTDGLLQSNHASGIAAAAAAAAMATSSGRTSANRNADVLPQDSNNNNNDDAAHDSNSGGDNSNSNKNSSSNNNLDSSSSWKPPLWLQSDGGGGDGGSGAAGAGAGAGKNNSINNNTSRKMKTFRIPIPPVPADLRQVISKRITVEQWNPPEQARIRVLSTKLRDQKVRVEKVQDKIAMVQQKKDLALNEIRTRHDITCQQAMDEIRQGMIKEHDEKMKLRAMQWKRKVEQEFQAQWKLRTEERLAQREQAKRMHEESKSAAAASDAVAAAESSSLLEPPQKKARLEAGSGGDNDNGGTATRDDDVGDKKDAATDSPSTAAAATTAAAGDVGEPLLESTVKQKQLEELQKEADSLNQNRAELIWLLKQVIKSEEKQKAKLATSSKPPESRIIAPKQA